MFRIWKKHDMVKLGSRPLGDYDEDEEDSRFWDEVGPEVVDNSGPDEEDDEYLFGHIIDPPDARGDDG